MYTYAVTYSFSAEPEEVQQIRPTHREWLASQLAEGNLQNFSKTLESRQSYLLNY